jgi:subtilisin family serine protease
VIVRRCLKNQQEKRERTVKRRILALCLILPALSVCAAGFTASAAPAADTEEKLVTDDLADYADGQVLVGYQDGSFALLTYEGDDDLAAGLAALAEDEDVTLVQPNYTYESTGLTTSDPLLTQQWALDNDGSFRLETQANQYPVYDDPFAVPALPGRWTKPWSGSGTNAQGASTQLIQSVAGIDINVADAWAVYDGGSRDVVVALIDTGVDVSHQELQHAIWVNEAEIPGNGIDDDGNGYIDDVNGWNFYNNNNQVYTSSTEDSHGTHGAGTIAAKADNGTGVAGIVQSDHVKIMVLKALGGSDGSGTTASIIQAIQYAQANGASICNLSLGNSVNDRALYRAMASSSMLFVVAAGNDGADADASPSYPACYDLDNIISVANLNCDGTLHDSSNYGAVSVDLAAPGSYILSTTPGNGYGYMTGTSMAAPMVTAAAAMVYSSDESLTLAGVKEILLSSTRSLTSLKGKTVTRGLLDLGAAMTYDHSALSGAAWNTGTAWDGGSAPVLTLTTETRQNTTYLLVTATDPDGDLAVTAYASGFLSAEQFQGGAAGQTFDLSWDGTRRFSVTSSGVYTFYAADQAGNETVQAVSITCKTRGADIWTGVRPIFYWGRSTGDGSLLPAG